MYSRHSWTTCVAAMMLNVAAIVNAGANEANTYYVSLNGDDINPGTKTEPFRTIQKAASIVQAGSCTSEYASPWIESGNRAPPRPWVADRLPPL